MDAEVRSFGEIRTFESSVMHGDNEAILGFIEINYSRNEIAQPLEAAEKLFPPQCLVR